MTKLRISRKAACFTESVIREMTRLAHRARRRQPVAGIPRFPGARGDQGGGAATPSTPTSTSTPSPGARPTARRHRPRRRTTARPDHRSGHADHGLLRIDRGDDRDAARHRRSRRRGDRLRAVLRELRPGRDPVGRHAALRHAARAATGRSIPTSSPPPSTIAPARSSSTRRTTRPARSSPARSSRPSPRCAAAGTRIAITDEIYEHIVYDGAAHVPLMTLDGMAERTVTISGMSKTFSVTGWRIG